MRVAAQLRLLWLGLFIVAVPQQGMSQDKRLALVIGNSAYRQTAALRNGQTDAADMAATLRRLGFRVIEGSDLDKAAMDAKVREFAEALTGAEQGVFYYAGHGLQVSGENYLIPVDARLATPAALDAETVRLDVIQRAMEQTAKFNVLFLDACRDNPLALALAGAMGTRSGEVGRGLALSMSSLGTLISYSTQPGNVALDGDGRNSPFAAALLRHIASPGRDLSAILLAVRNDVVRATGARQIPWEHSSLWAPFYFAPGGDAAPAVAALPAAEQQRELALWSSVKGSRDPAALRSYVDRFPQGAFTGPAMMSIARLERWSGASVPQRFAGARQTLRDNTLPPIDPEWRAPRAAETTSIRCRRLYALAAASLRQARLQCALP